MFNRFGGVQWKTSKPNTKKVIPNALRGSDLQVFFRNEGWELP